jgi:FMN phosphatase YigB (HAD superfamily)
MILLDVDETLAHQNQAVGLKKVAACLSSYGAPGNKTADDFAKIYLAFNHIYHGKGDAGESKLHDEITSYKIKMPEDITGERLTWSRELWLKVVAEKNGLDISDEKIIAVIDAYWEGISLASPIYPDALAFLSKVKDKFLVVGSDRRLSLEDGRLAYDPEIAHEKKIKRLFDQGFAKFFDSECIITGDPYDKPHLKFWQKAMGVMGISDPPNVILVDDSLKIAKSGADFGFDSYLIDRVGHYTDIELGRIHYITSLEQLLPRFK